MAEKDQEPTTHHVDDEKHDAQRNASVYSEQVKVSDFKADAIEAENAEHNMTVLQAVRAYPMATFWAFIMSFMIVSRSNAFINPTCS
jgi:MFS transporter, SP family, general alpha glucoside:H+ symporter